MNSIGLGQIRTAGIESVESKLLTRNIIVPTMDEDVKIQVFFSIFHHYQFSSVLVVSQFASLEKGLLIDVNVFVVFSKWKPFPKKMLLSRDKF